MADGLVAVRRHGRNVHRNWCASVSLLSLCAFHCLVPTDSAHAQADPARTTQPTDAEPSITPPLPPIMVRAPAQQKQRPKAVPRRAPARAPAAPPPPASPVIPEDVTVAAPAYQSDPVKSASEQTRTGTRINEQPAARPGEVLETVPGLIVTQHSGEGKANQYFLRGFNLDHGTDLAITVDGMPLNMPTHGHGQGYADVNFLIPELIASMNVKKGPYYANEGDFASAGALSIDYYRRLPQNFLDMTFGSFGYARSVAAGSTKLGAGDLMAAFEATKYEGPWRVGDDVQKFNGVLRYAQGTA